MSGLFAAEPAPTSVGDGDFYCPECGTRRRYRRTRVDRRLRVLGAGLPGGRYGEYVECATCSSTFRPEVLAYDAGERTADVVGEYQVALRRILALMVAVDGVVRDREIAMVRHIFRRVTGRTLSRSYVLAEVRDAGDAPTQTARLLARVVGYLNDHGKEQILRGAAMVSRCDGELHQREAEMVHRLGAVLRFTPERVQRILDSAEVVWTTSGSEPSS